MVDYIMQSTYGEVDLNEDPVIVPRCGHLMTLSSMDGHMDMGKYYELTDTSVKALKSMPGTLDSDMLKVCPMCRGSLRNLNRYNRIVRQLLLEQSTKKFIAWAMRQYVPLQMRLSDESGKLSDSMDTTLALIRATTGTSLVGHGASSLITLERSSFHQLSELNRFSALKDRHAPISRLRGEIRRFLRKVSEEEQPYGRVFDMVRDLRRRQGIESSLQPDESMLNTRNRLLATSLAIQCDLVIVSDFVALRKLGHEQGVKAEWVQAGLQADFTENRAGCQQLIDEAASRSQPMQMVEAQISDARWSYLEYSALTEASDRAATLRTSALQRLVEAEATCKAYPGSTRGMQSQVAAVRRMVEQSSFYSIVDNEEKRQVYAAMAAEFSGTGHWYRCANGHPFTVGECGGPMQATRCPQCGAPVGGRSHEPAEGVTRDDEFDAQFGGMRL